MRMEISLRGSAGLCRSIYEVRISSGQLIGAVVGATNAKWKCNEQEVALVSNADGFFHLKSDSSSLGVFSAGGWTWRFKGENDGLSFLARIENDIIKVYQGTKRVGLLVFKHPGHKILLTSKSQSMYLNVLIGFLLIYTCFP